MNNDKTIREIFDTLNECQKQELYGTIGDLLGDHISIVADVGEHPINVREVLDE